MDLWAGDGPGLVTASARGLRINAAPACRIDAAEVVHGIFDPMLKGSLRSRLREIEVAVVDKAATLRVEMLLDNERLLGERWNGSA